MPSADRPPVTRGVAARSLLFIVALALGAVAMWLIVTGDSQKRVQLGVIVGLWGLLLGALSLGRRMHAEPVVPAPAPVAEPVDVAGMALELRSAMALERSADVEARREYIARLEQMLRREIHESVADEVSALRSDIAQLRSEVVEKVGGQLRLERIETTRLIGSDLEALHHEVRQLKSAHDTSDLPTTEFAGLTLPRMRQTPVSNGTTVTSLPAAPAVAAPHVVEPEPEPAMAGPEPVAETQSAVAEQSEPELAVEPAPVTEPVVAEQPEPESVVGPEPEPTVAEQPEPEPAGAEQPEPDAAAQPDPESPAPRTRSPFDELSALPRLTPFTDFELDPIDPPPDYRGRRRRTDDPEPAGRHSDVGRRHRREDDDASGEDLLARLLHREGAR